MKTIFISYHICILLLIIISSLLSIHAIIDTINTNQTITDGGDTLISSGGNFELGFFSPGDSSNRYVGIWYKRSPSTVVWVANRETPITNITMRAGHVVFKVAEPSNLVLFLNDTNEIIWSTNNNNNNTSTAIRTPVAQLLDSGNLVIRDANDGSPQDFIWQSFEYPTDTLLPGMKLGWNLTANRETYLSSWTSDDDLSVGDLTYHCDPSGYPQNILRRGDVKEYRSGQWNGLGFSGRPITLRENPIFRFGLVVDRNEVYYHYEIINSSVITRFTLSQSGMGQFLVWSDRAAGWVIYSSEPTDACDVYNVCGAYGICRINSSPMCECLDKFVPSDLDGWNIGDWSSGCVRRTSLSCEGDVFLNYTGIKLPDPQNSWFDSGIIILDECAARCLRNCSCVAYTRLDIREGGSGCLIYYGELSDIKSLPEGGQDLYVRTASSELEPVTDSMGHKRVMLIASFTSVVGVVLLCLSLFLCIQKRKKGQNIRKEVMLSKGSHGKDLELPFFKISTILKATDNFSINHKLGQGGFGPVYKGMLEDGEEIAVKRLSKTSAQGVGELKNEVILIAKLQHWNLVTLLGCCIQGDENMLVYEYMPNNSLDRILFDQSRSVLLDWRKSYNIINGIAKGLLYLHQDSRLRIIHRDLKAGNVLLDSEMNPKISDFGLARSVAGNETEAQTGRVVGTFGYMSPEYAVDGLFSVKSDVFSFGVLLLEVVSGNRNRGFFSSDHNLNLLGHAWKLYKEDKSLELVDPSLGESFDKSEVERSIHVGLLCVQKYPEDRPNMSSVVFMLGNDVQLPQAKQPGFFMERDVLTARSLTYKNEPDSVNEVTTTLPQGR